MAYIVWIGGIDDHYKTKKQAEQAVEYWESRGYDDVVLEIVKNDGSLYVQKLNPKKK